MKSYYRFMLGRHSVYSEECFKGGYICLNDNVNEDLSVSGRADRKEFNKQFGPVLLKTHPEKTKVAVGMSCGIMYTMAYGIDKGDIVFSPDGSGLYRVGEVASGYSFHPNNKLPHRRSVNWFSNPIRRADMSDALRNSTGATGTIVNMTKYSDELDQLIGGQKPPVLVHTDKTVEDPSVFALEAHLEDFLVKNWSQTELGKNYDIYEDDGELIGQQYETDTGRIDILAISKDKKELLVVELKKGRASDAVVGQIQRYMGYVIEELVDKGQVVKGVIIALEDDLKLRRSLVVAQNITFYRYQVSFKLFEG